MTDTLTYRKDIDVLRAISVIAVFLFHTGYAPNGYLGVDVFFVISGYLITHILWQNAGPNFSLWNFYKRRIRRIVPLLLMVITTSLAWGFMVMLPDDFENLSQSVIATLLFINNLLLYLTTHDYWAVANEFKPLMHTWSLGIEEQFYLIYPWVFVLIKNRTYLLWFLMVSIIVSFGLYLRFFPSAETFYFLPFRWFEIGIGGILALTGIQYRVNSILRLGAVLFLVSIFFIELANGMDILLVPMAVVLTLAFLGYRDNSARLAGILGNEMLVVIGKWSYGIYLWHQILLAFTKYYLVVELGVKHVVLIAVSTLALSGITYYFIEQPFRYGKWSPKNAMPILGVWTMLLLLSAGFWVYKGGVVRDVPELNIDAGAGKWAMHSAYNKATLERPLFFSQKNKIHVAVIGDSYATDWVNVLVESQWSDSLEVVLIHSLDKQESALNKADRIYLALKEEDEAWPHWATFNYRWGGLRQTWRVGTKKFGRSPGYYYNLSDEDRCTSRAPQADGCRRINQQLRHAWSSRFIDIIGALESEDGGVPIFTPECDMISYDTYHLTPMGAQYLGEVCGQQINESLRHL